MGLKLLMLLRFSVSFVLVLQAQDVKLSKQEKQEKKEANRVARDGIEKMLTAFTACPANETEFVVLAVERIAKNKNQTLARDTSEGVKGVSRTDSYDVLITFKDKMRFADVRPDRSVPEKYENDRRIALDNLQYLINTGKSMALEKPMEKKYNGFTTFSVHRSELIGNTLGITLILDEADTMITTIYFANAPKDNDKHFKNIQEWLTLRDKFLGSYAKCVTNKLVGDASGN